jgi:hypothetical protein
MRLLFVALETVDPARDERVPAERVESSLEEGSPNSRGRLLRTGASSRSSWRKPRAERNARQPPSTRSRPIAVRVINHLGNQVMKVFRVA